MQLLWVHYDGRKYILILKLGEHNNKLVCLDAQKLSTELIRLVRKNIDVLVKLSLVDKINWIRGHLPGLMSAFKTLDASKVKVVSTYEVKS